MYTVEIYYTELGLDLKYTLIKRCKYITVIQITLFAFVI